MGLLTSLLVAPVKVPLSGMNFILREIQKAVDRELNDPDAIRREMLELQQRLDAGLIEEAEYDLAEAELLKRLNAIAERQGAGDAGEDVA